MVHLSEHLQTVLVASVYAHGLPDGAGSRRPLLHLRMGGMQQGVKHHAWPTDAPHVDREDLEALRELGLMDVTPQPNSWAFHPTSAGYRLGDELGREGGDQAAARDNRAVGVPGHRALLQWFHRLEDDPARSAELRDGWTLIQAARADNVIDTQDVDGFATLVLQMADQGLIDFDNVARGLQQFGHGNAPQDLQQSTNFRSTAHGRQWLQESPSSGPSFTFDRSTVGQVAGGNITNFVSFSQVLEAAENQLGQIDADPADREAARGILHALGGRATEVATGAGGALAARAIAAALGLPT